eukprot:jgi/Mesvir1/15158/Mv26216-RA.3
MATPSRSVLLVSFAWHHTHQGILGVARHSTSRPPVSTHQHRDVDAAIRSRLAAEAPDNHDRLSQADAPSGLGADAQGTSQRCAESGAWLRSLVTTPVDARTPKVTEGHPPTEQAFPAGGPSDADAPTPHPGEPSLPHPGRGDIRHGVCVPAACRDVDGAWGDGRGDWAWGGGSVAGLRRSLESSLARRVVCPAPQVVCPLRYRPRQFEYHPTLPEYMIVGSIAGQVLLVRHVAGQVVAQVDSMGAPHSVLGLCWLHNDPAKLVAGADDGTIQLFDISALHPTLITRHRPAPRRPACPPVASGASWPPARTRDVPMGSRAWVPASSPSPAGTRPPGWRAGLSHLNLDNEAASGPPHFGYSPSRPLVTAPAAVAGASGGVAAAGGSPRVPGRRDPVMYTYPEFRHLTSVHINCTDQLFVTSGYSTDVGLYDLSTGQQLQRFQNLHKEHINVVKFSHSAPSIFATSSFDRDIKLWDVRRRMDTPLYTARSSRGNVMVCFSPDDRHLLVSAIDNEVRQLLAVDGREELRFDIPATGGGHNYTRSYYMNGSDYAISGSCEENSVRVLCTRTGRRLRDITLEGSGLDDSLYVQSLRADPCRPFQLSVLAACNRSTAHSHVLKLDLLSEASVSQPACVGSTESRWGMGA